MTNENGDIVDGAENSISTSIRNPPPFTVKRHYPTWKTEFTLWTKMTTQKEENWSNLIVFSISPKEDNGLRERIVRKLGDTIYGKDGHKLVIKYLESNTSRTTLPTSVIRSPRSWSTPRRST